MDYVGGAQNHEREMTHLFILRTNIDSRSAFRSVKRELQKLPGVHLCTIDLDDRDKVLRVACENISIERIVEEVRKQDFFCEELED